MFGWLGIWGTRLRACATFLLLKLAWQLKLDELIPVWHNQAINIRQLTGMRCALELQREVADHEPVSALDGGDEDGLAALHAIATAAVDLLQPGVPGCTSPGRLLLGFLCSSRVNSPATCQGTRGERDADGMRKIRVFV